MVPGVKSESMTQVILSSHSLFRVAQRGKAEVLEGGRVESVFDAA